MGLILAFLLGIANFTAQRAVLESGHPMLTQLPPVAMQAGKYASLTFEFVLLVTAMLAARSGLNIWLWVYCGYSFCNGLAAWMIANRRI